MPGGQSNRVVGVGDHAGAERDGRGRPIGQVLPVGKTVRGERHHASADRRARERSRSRHPGKRLQLDRPVVDHLHPVTRPIVQTAHARVLRLEAVEHDVAIEQVVGGREPEGVVEEIDGRVFTRRPERGAELKGRIAHHDDTIAAFGPQAANHRVAVAREVGHRVARQQPVARQEGDEVVGQVHVARSVEEPVRVGHRRLPLVRDHPQRAPRHQDRVGQDFRRNARRGRSCGVEAVDLDRAPRPVPRGHVGVARGEGLQGDVVARAQGAAALGLHDGRRAGARLRVAHRHQTAPASFHACHRDRRGLSGDDDVGGARDVDRQDYVAQQPGLGEPARVRLGLRRLKVDRRATGVLHAPVGVGTGPRLDRHRSVRRQQGGARFRVGVRIRTGRRLDRGRTHVHPEGDGQDARRGDRTPVREEVVQHGIVIVSRENRDIALLAPHQSPSPNPRRDARLQHGRDLDDPHRRPKREAHRPAHRPHLRRHQRLNRHVLRRHHLRRTPDPRAHQRRRPRHHRGRRQPRHTPTAARAALHVRMRVHLRQHPHRPRGLDPAIQMSRNRSRGRHRRQNHPQPNPHPARRGKAIRLRPLIRLRRHRHRLPRVHRRPNTQGGLEEGRRVHRDHPARRARHQPPTPQGHRRKRRGHGTPFVTGANRIPRAIHVQPRPHVDVVRRDRPAPHREGPHRRAQIHVHHRPRRRHPRRNRQAQPVRHHRHLRRRLHAHIAIRHHPHGVAQERSDRRRRHRLRQRPRNPGQDADRDRVHLRLHA